MLEKIKTALFNKDDFRALPWIPWHKTTNYFMNNFSVCFSVLPWQKMSK